MGRRLSIGISEDRNFRFPTIPSASFSPTGRYRSAILKLKTLIDSPGSEKKAKDYWDRCKSSGSTLPAADFEGARRKYFADIEWVLVYEAESARIWAEGPLDYMETLRRYQRQAVIDSARIRNAIDELRRFDRKHPYLLRHTVQRAMQEHLASETKGTVKLPNANAKRGFNSLTISGPMVREAEFRYLTKISIFEFSEFLDSWNREIDAIFSEWPLHWKEFGALRFKEPLRPVAAAKLDVVQLGLVARLTSRLRDFTAGYGIWAYSTGQPIPQHGKPCWEIVAEFVNCALARDDPLSGDSVRRVWQSITSKHEITMQSWPKPSKSESQITEIPDLSSATPKSS